jgi:type I restriction enzyme, S subunit
VELKPGYKQTEVGVIPNEWEIAPLGRVVQRLDAGVSVNSVDEELRSYGHDQSILKTSAITNGQFLPWECKKIAPKDLSRAKLNPCANTILISRMNTPELVGECGYVETDHSHLFLPDRLWMTHFRDEREICVRWLNYLLSSRSYKTRIKGLATGTSGSMKNIAKDGLLAMPVPYPNYDEQRAIAGVLSDVDALIGALDQLIAKKRDLKQAAMQQLLTGQTRLPGFSGKREVKRFADVAFPRCERVDPQETRVHEFCVELAHIESTSGQLVGSTSTDEHSSLKSVFRTGDVLFGKLRAYLRKYWLATRSGVCSTEIWVLVPKEDLIMGSYLFQIIKTDQFIEAASNSYGTHMPRSDWNVVKNYEIRLPLLTEQTAIAQVLSDMDAELAALEQRRDKTRALKQGMMQELLTGRTRLV